MTVEGEEDDDDWDAKREYGLVPFDENVDLSNGGVKEGVLLRYADVETLNGTPHLRVSNLAVGERAIRVVGGVRSDVIGLVLTKKAPASGNPGVRFHWTLKREEG